MPENWKKYNLGDLSEDISYSYTESASKEEIGPKFLRITDIQNDFIDWNEVPYCKISEKNLIKYQVEIGDIVVARTGNSTGATSIIKNEINAVFASYLIRYRLNKRIAFPNFIDFVLRSISWTNYVDAIKGGSAQPGANAKQFAAFEINLPPLEEQKSIASILSALDDKIELNLQLNKTLEEMAMALYKHWFVDFGPFQDGEFVDSELGEIPKGWEVKKLGDVAEVGSSKRIFRNEYVEYGIPFFRGKEIIQLSQGKSISTELFIKADKYNTIREKFGVPQKDDILISSVGTIGVSWLVENNKPFYFKDGNLTWIKNYKPVVNGHIISQWLKSSSTQDQIKGETIGSTQQALTISALRTLKIALPKDESYVEDISEKLKLWNTALVSNRKEIEFLTQLRDTLLPKLISGEVRVKEVEKIVTEAL